MCKTKPTAAAAASIGAVTSDHNIVCLTVMADSQNKVAIKMDDERFLRSKPELRWLVESFVEVCTMATPF